MRTKIVACIVASLALAITAPAWADEVDDVAKNIQAKWKEHKSFTAKMKIDQTMPGGMGTMNGDGSIAMVREGDKTKIRLDYKATTKYKAGDQDTTTEQNTMMVVDGEFAWMLIDNMGQKMAMKLDIDPQMTGEPDKMFETMKKDYELKVLPEEKIAGHDCWVIEGTPKDKAGGMSKVKSAFAKDSGLMIQNLTFGEDGKPMQTMTYTDVVVDAKVDPAQFKFEAPAGVQVMDQTKKAGENKE